MSYFDILINGSQEEKYDLTFRLIDTDGKGYFTYDEFYDMITSMLQSWNNITGNNFRKYFSFENLENRIISNYFLCFVFCLEKEFFLAFFFYSLINIVNLPLSSNC